MQDDRTEPMRAVAPREPCHHGNLATFTLMDVASFFTETYYSKNKNAPRECGATDCNKTFGGTYKVGINAPVYACLNGQNKIHECRYAYCVNCYNK